MTKALLLAERLSRILAWIGGGLIILSALLVTLEVVLRKLFNVSIGGADELSGYAFGIATTLGFSFALFERAHVRVDAAYMLFPGWLKLIASLIGLALLIGFAAIVTMMAWSLVADTITHQSQSITPMRTPLMLPQIPWLIGWIFFVLCGLLILLAALTRLLSGDHKGADQLIGMKSIEEQIEDEAGGKSRTEG